MPKVKTQPHRTPRHQTTIRSHAGPKAGQTGTPVRAAPAPSTGITTRGRVASYRVTEKALIIKLDCSAISRLAVYVPTDAPHFQSALSVAMLAYSERTRTDAPDLAYPSGTIWVSTSESLPDNPPADGNASGLVLRAEAIGHGLNDPFEIADWVMSPNWVPA